MTDPAPKVTFSHPVKVHSIFTYPSSAPVTDQIFTAGFLELEYWPEHKTGRLTLRINDQIRTTTEFDAETFAALAAFMADPKATPEKPIEWKDE